MTLRMGIIGLGMMGRHHARVAREVEGVQLVAVADAKVAAELYAWWIGRRGPRITDQAERSSAP